MEAFTFTYPTKVYFGHGVAAQALWQELAKVGRTVMLAYGGGSVKRSGVYDELKGLLLEAGKEVVDFPGIQPNPTYATAQAGAALARERGVDFVLAVGGGSVIDCCKVICAQTVLEEDLWKMEYERGAFPSAGLPMGAVVTASGTGAEMNSGAVITCEDKLWKGPIVGTAPPVRFWTPPTPRRCRACRSSPARLTRCATRWRRIWALRTRTTCPTTWRLRSSATP